MQVAGVLARRSRSGDNRARVALRDNGTDPDTRLRHRPTGPRTSLATIGFPADFYSVAAQSIAVLFVLGAVESEGREGGAEAKNAGGGERNHDVEVAVSEVGGVAPGPEVSPRPGPPRGLRAATEPIRSPRHSSPGSIARSAQKGP